MSDLTQPCPRVTLARSGLTVSRIGLGLAHVHLMSPAAGRRLIDVALELGITHFDTARLYSDGLSEHLLGSVLGRRRSEVTITTKFGLLPTPLIGRMGPLAPLGRKVRSALVRAGASSYPVRDYTPAQLQRSLASSLRALRTDHVDVLALHEPAGLVGVTDEMIEALVAIRRSGKARLIGVAGDDVQPIVNRWGDVLDIVQTAESRWRDTGRPPDITYSVFSSARRSGDGPLSQAEVDARLASAIAHRPSGAVLVQTRTPERLRRFVDIVTA